MAMQQRLTTTETDERPQDTAPRTAATATLLPPLENGDRLTRSEFERRYEAMPRLKKAELIEGVVYVGSPVRHTSMASQTRCQTWLGTYRVATPGTTAGQHDRAPRPGQRASAGHPAPDARAGTPRSARMGMLRARLNWWWRSRPAAPRTICTTSCGRIVGTACRST